jgi:urease gamma subunit
MNKRILLCLALSSGLLSAGAALTATSAMAQEQQTTIVRPDGTKVVIIHRGAEYGDGYYTAAHDWVRVDRNGNVVTDHANGSKTVVEPDGTKTHVNASGDTTVQTNPDGSKVITKREGQ